MTTRPILLIKEHFWLTYLAIGGVLAIPVFLSYIYALYAVDWHYGLDLWNSDRQSTITSLMFWMFVSTGLRVFLWPLSLLLWLNDFPAPMNFGMWLAPGFYVEMGGSA